MRADEGGGRLAGGLSPTGGLGGCLGGSFSLRRALEGRSLRRSLGRRPGFRDVRREVVVAPGGDGESVEIRCTEPI